MVGETVASRLVEVGNEVMMGSRTKDNEKAAAWTAKAGDKASAGTFEEAAAFGEVIFNCTLGAASLQALAMAREDDLRGKVIVDLSNPLDFSQGMPPSLFVSNTDSLGEQIQKRFPEAKVVKALNTMWCGLMVNPRMLSENHATFVCGNDADAKDRVKEILRSFGWRDEEILDLGDITAARGTESYLPLWLRIYGATQTGAFNIKIVAAG
jgi:hypothetical protein